MLRLGWGKFVRAWRFALWRGGVNWCLGRREVCDFTGIDLGWIWDDLGQGVGTLKKSLGSTRIVCSDGLGMYIRTKLSKF